MGKVIHLFKGEKQMREREINIKDVAKTFLTFGTMTHKKLQKLCYYAQALHLAINDEPLVDAEFQAWVHGPVCPKLYQEYKSNGAFRISIENSLPKSIHRNSYEYVFLQSIYKKYGHLTGNELETLTHTESPWINARERAGVYYWQPSNEPISQEDMMIYYRKEIN